MSRVWILAGFAAAMACGTAQLALAEDGLHCAAGCDDRVETPFTTCEAGCLEADRLSDAEAPTPAPVRMDRSALPHDGAQKLKPVALSAPIAHAPKIDHGNLSPLRY